MALSSKDGSVLWSYSRKHMTYAPAGWNSSRGELVTSPDGKYVAARVQLPTFVASPQAITLVFDALTGRLVFERQGAGGYLQLTDSAVLRRRHRLLTDRRVPDVVSPGERRRPYPVRPGTPPSS